MRTRVFISGPISVGDVEANVLRAITVGIALLDAGYAPHIPHLSVYAERALCLPPSSVGRHRYEAWLEVDAAWVQASQALLRLKGISLGADREVQWARQAGIPVYYDYQQLLNELPPQTS